MGSGHDHDAHGHHHAAHGHHHGHHHGPADYGRAFALGVALNLAFVVAEAVFGLISGSMALLADAGHNLSDVMSLLIAWGAASLSRKQPGGKYTYGLRGSSILAALINGILLLLAIGAIAGEAVRRLLHPAPTSGMTMVILAAIGIAVNAGTAMLFFRGRKDDLNIRGAYLHMVADAAVSGGVVIAGLAILATGFVWIDPAVSLVIVAVIAAGTWGLLRESVDMSLHAVPNAIDRDAVAAFLGALPGVAAVHDLHIWSISTSETALTAHLIMPSGHGGDTFLAETTKALEQQFRIGHATLQVETGTGTECVLAPDSVV